MFLGFVFFFYADFHRMAYWINLLLAVEIVAFK